MAICGCVDMWRYVEICVDMWIFKYVDIWIYVDVGYMEICEDI